MSAESTFLSIGSPLTVDADRAEFPAIPDNFEEARGMLARASNYLWNTRHERPYHPMLRACQLLDDIACEGRYL